MDDSDEEENDIHSNSPSHCPTHCKSCKRGIEGCHWYACTECHTGSENFNFCKECIAEGKHGEHSEHIHEFNWNMKLDLDVFDCYSCGYTFAETPGAYVFRCHDCNEYCLCKRCHSQDMHSKHRHRIKFQRLDEYIDSLE